MPDIVLRSNDGADHRISVESARLSKTVASLLQDLEGALLIGLMSCKWTLITTNDILPRS